MISRNEKASQSNSDAFANSVPLPAYAPDHQRQRKAESHAQTIGRGAGDREQRAQR